MSALIALLLIGGCASFGEGLGRALLQQGQTEDTRQCYVRGSAFDGVEQMLEQAQQVGPKTGGELKVLMVHGIGTHLPGYSTRLAENLARELSLNVVNREPKEITLRLPPLALSSDPESLKGLVRGKPGDPNGSVRVNTYRTRDGSREMVFYELTWSEITDVDKRIIAYDDSGEYSFRRAELNNELKQFVNSHLPDPLIYLGDAQINIQAAVSQTLCWMFTRDSDELPQRVDGTCTLQNSPPEETHKDTFVFVGHSLGSRIIIDALQRISAALADQAGEAGAMPGAAEWRNLLRSERLTIFMLSNQLPLLQLGRRAPAVTNQYADYCTADGPNYEERIFARVNIVAFSDPNDILSWAVPPDYENNYMDSRLCPNLVNVIINIAEVKKLFGVELAAPGEAHSGYDNDERVIKLIAHGMGHGDTDPLVKERCEWMEVR